MILAQRLLVTNVCTVIIANHSLEVRCRSCQFSPGFAKVTQFAVDRGRADGLVARKRSADLVLIFRGSSGADSILAMSRHEQLA